MGSAGNHDHVRVCHVRIWMAPQDDQVRGMIILYAAECPRSSSCPVIRLLYGHLRGYMGFLVATLALQLVQTLAGLYLLQVMADIIDTGVRRGDTSYILATGAGMLAIALVQMAASAGAAYCAGQVAVSVGRDLRSTIFHHVQTFSVNQVNRFGSSALITRSTSDVRNLQMLTQTTLNVALPAPVLGIGGVVLVMRQDPRLALLLLVAVPVMVACVALLFRRIRALVRRMQERVEGIHWVMREQIGGIRVIRAFVREAHERQRFVAANNELVQTSLRFSRAMALLSPMVMGVLNLSGVAVIWLGASLMASGSVRAGALTAVLTLLSQTMAAVMMALSLFVIAPRAAASAERIREVLATESTVLPPKAPRMMNTTPAGMLEIRDVTVGYPGAEEPVLRGVSLTAYPGQTTAIVGSTGSGKTTLVNLVPRLFDPASGDVLIDGVNVRELDPDELASVVGMVPQQSYLFSGTIASNLRFGDPDATDERLWEALSVAQAREFVEALPEGLAAPVAQGGGNFSGGQRQRLTIARALVAPRRVYLFDDAFSALDYGTDAAVRAGLAQAIGTATVVVVAQRISTVLHADQIVVLDQGQVVGAGTHAELAAHNTTYQEIVLSQAEPVGP
ncbi:ABC transporter ATP-binding protein [Nonomuraea insulae]|uniref:ABC transporter ATP-binding protein n=1 Tax=Nonomuraea insulae TaxID=1616787 RepID=A0ABW1CU37_9ACTN